MPARPEVGSTGNGRCQSNRHRPVVRMTNTMIVPVDSDPDDILSSRPTGLFATRMGRRPLNTVNGDFLFKEIVLGGRKGEPGLFMTLLLRRKKMGRKTWLQRNPNGSLAGAFTLVLTVTLLCFVLRPAAARAANEKAGPEKYQSLNTMLTPYLARYRLPALSAAVVKKGVIVAAGAVGTRRAGTWIPVTINDRFHLGSDTKAFTATLAGMFVDEGKLRWDSTLGEIYPELKDRMAPGLSKVTLLQLLSQTSGIPRDNKEFTRLIDQSYLQDGNLDELRYWLVSQWVKEPLAHQPGRVFVYSNINYVIAGSILERVGGKTWEELVAERIFDPLGLRTAGFGPQSSLGRIDAPVGHLIRDGKLKPMLAGPNGDNPLIMGPAGTIHMSVLDFAKWAGWNAGEGKRGPALVRPETLKKIHTPVIDIRPGKGTPPGTTPTTGKYALGWVQAETEWSHGPILWHAGSNGMNLAHIFVQPKYDLGFVLMTNVAGQEAEAAFRDLEKKIYLKFGPGR